MRKLKRYILFLFLVAVFFAAWISWQEANFGLGPQASSAKLTGPSREIAFVANSVDGTVSLVDLASRKVVKTLDILPDGNRVGIFRNPLQWLAQGYLEGRAGLNYAQDTDVSRDGRVLFVSRGYLGDVAAFDIASGGLLWRTPVSGLRADHMTLSPNGKRVYVSALIYGGNVVEVLDSASGEKLGEFPGGRWPHDVHTSPNGKRIYVASLGNMLEDFDVRDDDPDAYRVTVVNADTLNPVRYHEFEAGVRPFAVSRKGHRLYAQLSNAHAVVSYDLKKSRSLGRLELPVAPGVTSADWDFEAPHHGLALTRDDSMLCLAGRASDYAALVATDGLKLLHTVPVGDAPSWAALDRSGKHCLLPNNRSDNLSIVSMTEARELARIRVGRAPKHVSVGRVPVELLD
jgi:DNA-binding beta-propeller fold protein YncE